MTQFLLLGGHPAVDLVNTKPILAAGRTELLEDPADLAAWLGAAGLVPGARARRLVSVWRDDPAAAHAIERVRDYREVLRAAFKQVHEGHDVPVRAVAVTNKLMRDRPVALALRRRDGTLSLAHEGPLETVDDALGLATRAAADLFAHHDLGRLRRCSNPECVLFFLDETRSHTRRWCSMATCGNRAKQRGYQRRRASS